MMLIQNMYHLWVDCKEAESIGHKQTLNFVY